MLDHQRDLWADFRAFYRLAPAEALALPGPEYLALAYRTPAYQGVMAARLAYERKRAEDLDDDVTTANVASVAELDELAD